MSGRPGILLFIPYKYTKSQVPTVAEIAFDISCWQDFIILQEALLEKKKKKNDFFFKSN